jgi:predicted secreted hydrolase
MMQKLCLRRSVLQSGVLAAWGATLPAEQATALPVVQLEFPRDAGAHPSFQTEWWYLTGFANVGKEQAALGFQVTFFRRRIAQTQGMKSDLAAKQLLFAHAAVTDVRGKRLWHDQRIARWSGSEDGVNPSDRASASLQETAVRLGDWSLLSQGPDLLARVSSPDFSLDLRCVPSQPILLQGDQGRSRKGPSTSQASYYYSLPHLKLTGDIRLRGKRYALAPGSLGWLDHEWSQSILEAGAVGWDWIGINLSDGGALTAFQLRDKAGLVVWSGGSFRHGDALRIFGPSEVVFAALRHWQSPVSHASYPVEWRVQTPVQNYSIKAVLDPQELDSRATTGAIYWEGLCEVRNDLDQRVGRGYLEMTGYVTPLTL